MTAPSGLCEAGYYCPKGSASALELDCPTGRYCPEGTHTPELCPAGENIQPVKQIKWVFKEGISFF